MARTSKNAVAAAKKPSSTKRVYFKQSDFPMTSLQQAQKVASAITDNFGGTGGSPPEIALAIGIVRRVVLGPHSRARRSHMV